MLIIVICINPPPVDGKAYKPWRLRDSPESIAAGEAAHPELTKTTFVSTPFSHVPLLLIQHTNIQDSKLADAVVAYQMTLLGVVDNLIHRIESRQHGELSENSVHDAKTGNQELDESNDDLAELENLDYALKQELGGVEKDFKVLMERLADRMVRCSPPFFLPLVTTSFHSPYTSISTLDHWINDLVDVRRKGLTGQEIDKPILSGIYNTVAKLVESRSEPQFEIPAPPPPPQEKRESIPIEEGLGRLGVVSVGGVLGFVGWAGARRWRAGRVGKSSKLV